jgi:hypothetical protein
VIKGSLKTLSLLMVLGPVIMGALTWYVKAHVLDVNTTQDSRIAANEKAIMDMRLSHESRLSVLEHTLKVTP